MESNKASLPNRMIMKLAEHGDEMDVADLCAAVSSTFIEMAGKAPFALKSLVDAKLVQTGIQPSCVHLTVEGERLADSFRSLSASQTAQIERSTALVALEWIGDNKDPSTMHLPFIGPARRLGILGSLVRDGYVEQNVAGRKFALTKDGFDVLTRSTPKAG